MRRLAIVILIVATACSLVCSRNVTISVTDRPAPEVFREIMTQTGKNFVYKTEILEGMKITVTAENMPLKKVLKRIFHGTDIEYKIQKNQVILKKRPKAAADRITPARLSVESTVTPPDSLDVYLLDEVTVVSRLDAPAISTADMGAAKLTAGDILTTPVLFGESDVIKTIHTLPGVMEGTEGMAGMSVHGGEPDENLYLLDNVPLYQINHFGGFFSAFNADAIRYIDFFKTSIPAKYDGRLSSVLDVRSGCGNSERRHGSGRLGLTSGAFNIGGPIGNRTTYTASIRRSWFDVITIPLMAFVNSMSDDEKTSLRYDFTDLNIGLSHRFNDKTTGSVNVYYGEDAIYTGWKSEGYADYSLNEDEKCRFRWGNIVARAGIVRRISPTVTGEFTAAFTRYFSTLKTDNMTYGMIRDSIVDRTRIRLGSDNNINDWIARADFNWHPDGRSTVRFGAGYTLHSFLPSRMSRDIEYNDTRVSTSDNGGRYPGSQFNLYIEDDWTVSERLRINGGLHGSIFRISGHTHGALSPRLSVSYRPDEHWAIKAAYSRTAQFVHHLTWSYLSLPSDQWIPITGDFKPQTADKIAVGAGWQSDDGLFTASIEGYLKKMHNIIEYRDDYYLNPPMELWSNRLTSGRGTAKGIDFMVEKTFGNVTGHVSYSLSKTDRTFADKNGGKTYLARFDQPHSINILVKWQINPKVALNAVWTGHSGNRFTLMTETWQAPDFEGRYVDDPSLRTPVNNYRLPFYHRLDLGLTVRNSHGYWSFGLYNAYNHLNTIAIRRSMRDTHYVWPSAAVSDSYPVFQKVCLLPLIPSISYTWQF